jgi:hypothetical protein
VAARAACQNKHIIGDAVPLAIPRLSVTRRSSSRSLIAAFKARAWKNRKPAGSVAGRHVWTIDLATGDRG